MILEINGSLLEQTVDLANRLTVTITALAKQAYATGLTAIKSESEKVDASGAANGSFVETRISGTEVFIRQNWEKMSDEEMAQHLDLPRQMVGLKRRALGFRRMELFNKTPAGDYYAPSSLSDEQKQFVRKRLSRMKLLKIAEALSVPVAEVFRARNEISKTFIAKHWERVSDGKLARKLGYRSCTEVAHVRIGLGFDRRILHRKIPANFNKAEFERAITEGGKMITEFFREKGISVSRERMRQIADEFGIKTERAPAWYANRYGKPELADKAFVASLLSDNKESLSAAAGAVGIDPHRLSRICREHKVPLRRRVQKMVELVCANPPCGKMFKRPSTQVFRKDLPATKFFCCNRCKWNSLGELRRQGKERRESGMFQSQFSLKSQTPVGTQ